MLRPACRLRPDRPGVGGQARQAKEPDIRRARRALGAFRRLPGRGGHRAGRHRRRLAAADAGPPRHDPRHLAGGGGVPAALHRLRSGRHRPAPEDERRAAGGHRHREPAQARRGGGGAARRPLRRGRRRGKAGRPRPPSGDGPPERHVRPGPEARRRPLPDDVDLGHDGPAQGRPGSAEGIAELPRLHAGRRRPQERRPVLEHGRSRLGLRPLLCGDGAAASRLRDHVLRRALQRRDHLPHHRKPRDHEPRRRADLVPDADRRRPGGGRRHSRPAQGGQQRRGAAQPGSDQLVREASGRPDLRPLRPDGTRHGRQQPSPAAPRDPSGIRRFRHARISRRRPRPGRAGAARERSRHPRGRHRAVAPPLVRGILAAGNAGDFRRLLPDRRYGGTGTRRLHQLRRARRRRDHHRGLPGRTVRGGERADRTSGGRGNRRRRQARSGAHGDRQGLRGARQGPHAVGRAGERAEPNSSSDAFRATPIRAKSSSWTRCRRRRAENCSASSCATRKRPRRAPSRRLERPGTPDIAGGVRAGPSGGTARGRLSPGNVYISLQGLGAENSFEIGRRRACYAETS